MKNIRNLIIWLVIMVIAITLSGNAQTASAASKYIKVEDFIEYIVKEMEWEVESSSDKSYIDVAMDKGLLKNDDFKSYTSYLTRTDAAVIANRLDEIINLKYGYPTSK